MSDTEKLLPCPFCGHNKIITTSHVAGNGNTYIKASCRKCTASVWVWGISKKRAIEEWNKRVG